MCFHQNDICCLKTWAFSSAQLKNIHKLLNQTKTQQTVTDVTLKIIRKTSNAKGDCNKSYELWKSENPKPQLRYYKALVAITTYQFYHLSHASPHHRTLSPWLSCNSHFWGLVVKLIEPNPNVIIALHKPRKFAV